MHHIWSDFGPKLHIYEVWVTPTPSLFCPKIYIYDDVVRHNFGQNYTILYDFGPKLDEIRRFWSKIRRF